MSIAIALCDSRQVYLVRRAYANKRSLRVSPLFAKAGQRAMSVARDKIVITMDERLGNVWMSDFRAR